MPDDYEDLNQCALSPEREAEPVNTARECVFMRTNRDGVSAVRRFPRAAVCVNSSGTRLGGRTVTYKGTCTVHDDRATKDWFYPEFARHLRPDSERAAGVFQEFLDSPHRVIIEFVPDYSLRFDAELMWARSPEAVS